MDQEQSKQSDEVCPDFMQMRKKDNLNYRNLCREYARLISPPFLDQLAFFIITKPGDRYEEEVNILQKWTSQFKFFSDLNSKSSNVASRVHEKCCARITYEKVKKGQHVFMAGDIPEKFYIILSGEVNVMLQKNPEILDQEIKQADDQYKKLTIKDQSTSIRQRVKNILKQHEVLRKIEDQQKISRAKAEALQIRQLQLSKLKKNRSDKHNGSSESSISSVQSFSQFAQTSSYHPNMIQSPSQDYYDYNSSRGQVRIPWSPQSPRQNQHRGGVIERISSYSSFKDTVRDSLDIRDRTSTIQTQDLENEQNQVSPTNQLYLNLNLCRGSDYTERNSVVSFASKFVSMSSFREIPSQAELDRRKNSQPKNNYISSVNQIYQSNASIQLDQRNSLTITSPRESPIITSTSPRDYCLSPIQRSSENSPRPQKTSYFFNDKTIEESSSGTLDPLLEKDRATNSEINEIDTADYTTDPIYIGLGQIKLSDLEEPELFIQNGVMKHKYLLTLKKGQMFGELGLLMKKPRAATIIARQDTEFATLNASDFLSILQTGEMRKFNRRINFFASSLLQNCGRDVVVKFSYNFEKLHFEKGQVIYKQGDSAQFVYLLKKGLVQLQRKVEIEIEPTKTMQQLQNSASQFMKIRSNQKFTTIKINDYEPGQSFGEIEVLQEIPRANTAICISQKATVFVLSVKNFLSLLQENKYLVKGFKNQTQLKEKFENDRVAVFKSSITSQSENRKELLANKVMTEMVANAHYEKNRQNPTYEDPIFMLNPTNQKGEDLLDLNRFYPNSTFNNQCDISIIEPTPCNKPKEETSYYFGKTPSKRDEPQTNRHFQSKQEPQNKNAQAETLAQEQKEEFFKNNAFASYMHSLTEAKIQQLKCLNIQQGIHSPQAQANLIFNTMIECQEIRKESQKPYQKNAVSKPNLRMNKILLEPGKDVKEILNKSFFNTPRHEGSLVPPSVCNSPRQAGGFPIIQQQSPKSSSISSSIMSTFSSAFEKYCQKSDSILDTDSVVIKDTTQLSVTTDPSSIILKPIQQRSLKTESLSISSEQYTLTKLPSMKKRNLQPNFKQRVPQVNQVQADLLMPHDSSEVAPTQNSQKHHLQTLQVPIRVFDDELPEQTTLSTPKKVRLQNPQTVSSRVIYKNEYYVTQGVKRNVHTNFHSLSERKVPRQSNISQVDMSMHSQQSSQVDSFISQIRTQSVVPQTKLISNSFQQGTLLHLENSYEQECKQLIRQPIEASEKLSASKLLRVFTKFKTQLPQGQQCTQPDNLVIQSSGKNADSLSKMSVDSISEMKQATRACQNQKLTSKHNYFRNKPSKLYIIDRYQLSQRSVSKIQNPVLPLIVSASQKNFSLLPS